MGYGTPELPNGNDIHSQFWSQVEAYADMPASNFAPRGSAKIMEDWKVRVLDEYGVDLNKFDRQGTIDWVKEHPKEAFKAFETAEGYYHHLGQTGDNLHVYPPGFGSMHLG